jgi:hypothetical protein
MTMPQSVAEIFEHHVTLEAQGVDRMYLSFCVRRLQPDEGMLGFVRRHCDHRMDSKRCLILSAYINLRSDNSKRLQCLISGDLRQF